MKFWKKIKGCFNSWIKKHIIDYVPTHLEDEFSEKYRSTSKRECVRVRFPNESYPDEVYTFKIKDFKIKNTFDKEVFGKWIDTYVFVNLDDYNRLKNE
jgi:hypothetical protein